MGADLGSFLRGSAPALFAEVDRLAESWLRPLSEQLKVTPQEQFRPKQINDPVWGTIELMPWEVALLDTPMLQRLRGVRQLGLAHLVFPSASHSRLEHIVGVVGAVEEMTRALSRQIDRWNRDHPPQESLPVISDRDRYVLRLSALFHDVGHGPFSHASEPMLEVDSGFVKEADTPWRDDLGHLRQELKQRYALNKAPALSEVLALAVVYSKAASDVLGSDKLYASTFGPAADLQQQMAMAIIGAVDPPPDASYLSAIISSQVDADRIDYLARDAHHSGLQIGFDTDRLLARLEVLRMTEDFLDDSALREKVRQSKHGLLYQIGIAASGFGSFEQMLIGRTFLYDRLYHHHKIRAAEVMAQRLMLVLERDRAKRLSLNELMLPLSDDTMLSAFGGDVSHADLTVPTSPARELAKNIIDRRLFHRAFAVRSRFIASPPGLDATERENNQARLWNALLKEVSSLQQRYELGGEIYSVAADSRSALSSKGLLQEACTALPQFSADHVIVDFPGRKAEAIRLLARYPNGQLRVPEFSFNPVKWADAYDLQKRTSYVFAPREILPLVTLASKIVFLRRFGIALARDADGFIKSGLEVDDGALEVLREAGIIDNDIVEHLTHLRHSLVKVRASDLSVPPDWIKEDTDFASRLALKINKLVPSGLSHSDLTALGRTLGGMFRFMDTWHAGDAMTADLPDERALQRLLRDGLRLQSLNVVEGSEASGGESDLYVEDAVIIENKFEGTAENPETKAKGGGMQGRRYAIALNSQLVLVALAYRPQPGKLLSKPQSVEVRQIASESEGRVQIRFYFPYGAVTPSREKA